MKRENNLNHKQVTDSQYFSFAIVLPNPDHCICKAVRTKLSVWSGLKWGKCLFYIMHSVYIMRNDACKRLTSLQNSFTCCADRKGEHSVHMKHLNLWLKNLMFNDCHEWFGSPTVVIFIWG